MRFRLLHEQPLSINASSPTAGHYKPVGGVREATDHEIALRDYNPVDGRWLVLCEEHRTWAIFEVKSRTEKDYAEIGDPADLSQALIGVTR